MKKPALTVREVLRELRAQLRIHRHQEKVAGDIVTREHCRHGIAALTFAIRFIREHQVTVTNLQRTIDRIETMRKSAKKHGVTT